MSSMALPDRGESGSAGDINLQRARALQGTTAGLASRSVANAIDAVVTLGLVFGSYALIGVVRFFLTRHFRLPAPSRAVNATVFWALAVALMTAGWSGAGRTMGKHLVGLRVIRKDGGPLLIGRAFLRAVLYTLFPIGFAFILFSRDGRSLQDYVAGSLVVYDWSYRSFD